jgi:hypothetical protein
VGGDRQIGWDRIIPHIDRAGSTADTAYGAAKFLAFVADDKIAQFVANHSERVIRGETRVSSSSSARAFLRSGRSKPSVNHS